MAVIQAFQDGSSAAYLLRKTRLTTPEASIYLRAYHNIPLAASTLTKMRCQGGGPRFHRFGRAVLYARTDLDEWVSDKLISSVSHTSPLQSSFAN